MFNEVQGLLQRVTTGEVDTSSVSQAASDHVSSMDSGELQQHMQTAADNASNTGQSGIAQQLMALVSQHRSNPQGLKDAAISLIQSNPQILQHFPPGFVQGILARV